MNTEKVKLTQIRCNAANPRTIEKAKFGMLVDSILVLPKMMEIRPVVVDKRMVVYGGNMRTRALQAIAKMGPEELAERLSALPDFTGKTKGERDALVEWWGKWLEEPFAFIIRATDLSQDELREFMIKDNAAFGVWDWERLANEFDNESLANWGVDVWLPSKPDPSASNAGDEDENDGEDEEESSSKDKEEDDEGGESIDKVTITYPRDRMEDVARLLGLSSIAKKKYRLDELA